MSNDTAEPERPAPQAPKPRPDPRGLMWNVAEGRGQLLVDRERAFLQMQRRALEAKLLSQDE